MHGGTSCASPPAASLVPSLPTSLVWFLNLGVQVLILESSPLFLAPVFLPVFALLGSGSVVLP